VLAIPGDAIQLIFLFTISECGQGLCAALSGGHGFLSASGALLPFTLSPKARLGKLTRFKEEFMRVKISSFVTLAAIAGRL
jgi:hypothetical protein